jgi:hypothetical protein
MKHQPSEHNHGPFTRYITIRRGSLVVAVEPTPRRAGRSIPIDYRGPADYTDQLTCALIDEVLERDVRAREGTSNKDVAYCLASPDPWLIALAAVMWEGIVQGLSWDLIRLAVRTALDKLRQDGVAPTTADTRVKQSTAGLEFEWTEYQDGRKQYRLFLGLRRAYQSRKPAKGRSHHARRMRRR